MKILVQGDKNRLLKYKEFKCQDCGCVFIADQTEYKDISNQKDGPIFTIKCPCCNRSVFNTTYEFLIQNDVLVPNTLTAHGFAKQINNK